MTSYLYEKTGCRLWCYETPSCSRKSLPLSAATARRRIGGFAKKKSARIGLLERLVKPSARQCGNTGKRKQFVRVMRRCNASRFKEKLLAIAVKILVSHFSRRPALLI